MTRSSRAALRRLLAAATAAAGRAETDPALPRLVAAAPIDQLVAAAAMHRVSGCVHESLKDVAGGDILTDTHRAANADVDPNFRSRARPGDPIHGYDQGGRYAHRDSCGGFEADGLCCQDTEMVGANPSNRLPDFRQLESFAGLPVSLLYNRRRSP